MERISEKGKKAITYGVIVFGAIGLGVILFCINCILVVTLFPAEEKLTLELLFLEVFFLFIFSWVAILFNICGIVNPEMKRKRLFWALTVIPNEIAELLYFWPASEPSSGHWSKQLINDGVHESFNSQFGKIYVAIIVVGIIGFLILAITKIDRTPPLVSVLAIAAMYISTGKNVVWCKQAYGCCKNGNGRLVAISTLILINMFLVMCSVIREKITEWNQIRKEKMTSGELDEKQLAWYEGVLGKAQYWPVFALVATIPLLGAMLGISVLCGQRPDALIAAWTETADWGLSQRISPPNITVHYDEHYLCTVAAGGHEKVVKPIRMGERHGHRVVVNRQLEVANAFELVLEWKTPRLHRVIRNFYDKYGFPIARCIRTKTACDVVYVIMKPLEWFFTIVLYLTLVHPENVIAVQYLPGYRDVLERTERCRSGH